MAASVYLGTMGVAALNWPHAMASLTWAGGVTTSVFAFSISYYTLYLMLELHEREGRRCNRYHELGKLAFGRRCIVTCEAVPIGMDGACKLVLGLQEQKGLAFVEDFSMGPYLLKRRRRRILQVSAS